MEFCVESYKGKRLYFCGSTIKNALEYKQGETMVFKLCIKCEDRIVKVPYIKYECQGDDGQKSEGFIECDADGFFTFETSIKTPGFVYLKAFACDADKTVIEGADIFEGGAGADVEKIHLATEIPNDYFEYWDWLKKEVEKVEPEVVSKKKLADDRYPGYEAYDYRIKTAFDTCATFRVGYPKGAKKGSLKLRLGYMGYGIHSCNISPLCDFVDVQTNPHDIEFDMPAEYYDEVRKNGLNAYGFDREMNKDPKTTYWTLVFARDLQVIRFLQKTDEIWSLIGGRKYLVGASQGAMQACNLAVHTDVADECRISVPWLCDVDGTEKFGRIRGWRPENDKGIKYFDTAIAARYLKCPVLIDAGLGDYICPPSGQMAMFNGITAQKKLVFTQNRVHAGMPVEKVEYQL